MTSPQRFAFGVVALVLLATAGLFLVFAANPIAIGTWMARSALGISGYETATATGPRGEQTYFHAGAGGRTVVLLHGLGHHAGTWIKTTTDLADRHAVIIPDLAGHGDSEPQNGPLTLDDSVAGLAAVLDAAVGDNPVVLVGHSVGGWVALRFALAYPERVEHLVLVDSYGLPIEPAIERLPKTRQEALDLVRAITPASAPEPASFVLDDLVDSIHAGPTPRQIAGFRDADHVGARLHEIGVPVDLIWGQEDDLLPVDYGRQFVESLPTATFHELEHCGHIPQQQCPQAFSRLLFRILER